MGSRCPHFTQSFYIGARDLNSGCQGLRTKLFYQLSHLSSFTILCAVYVCVYAVRAYVYLCTCTCVYRGQRRTSGVLFYQSPPCFLERGSLTEPEVYKEQTSKILPLPSQFQGEEHLLLWQAFSPVDLDLRSLYLHKSSYPLDSPSSSHAYF